MKYRQMRCSILIISRNRLLIGSVKLKMYAPLANKQLRVKTAILSILMNGFW